MNTEPLLYETHSHTPLCKHAVGTPDEYAATAEKRGLKGLTVTCHNPLPAGHSPHVRMSADEFEEYLELVEGARERWQGRVDVLLGIEADYLAEYTPWLERQLVSAEFHFVLGSVHPQTAEYRQQYNRDDPVETQRVYFGKLAEAAETGLFDSISHPDLIKNETAHAWDPSPLMSDICRSLGPYRCYRHRHGTEHVRSQQGHSRDESVPCHACRDEQPRHSRHRRC